MNELMKACCEVFPVVVPDPSSLKSVNFYLMKQEKSLTLIDAGWNNDDCWNSLNVTLNHNGFSLQDITEIILTHHHIDHIGLVNRITASHPIPVYSHPDSIPRLKRDKDFLDMRVDFYSNLYREMDCGEYGEREVAYLRKAIHQNRANALRSEIVGITEQHLLNFSIIKIPGHAPDQIAFYAEEKGWLFAGDLLIDHLSSNALVEPDFSGKRIQTLSQHMNSLRKCQALNSQLVFSGHGKLIENPNILIQKRLERMQSKSERLIQLISTGISTGNNIAKAFYGKIYYEQFPLVMSEIIGHLDYLEATGKIKMEMIKGISHYSVK